MCRDVGCLSPLDITQGGGLVFIGMLTPTVLDILVCLVSQLLSLDLGFKCASLWWYFFCSTMPEMGGLFVDQ